MTLGELVEELVQRIAHVHPMLDQALRALIGLPNLALGLVSVQKPLVAERLRVLLPRLPDDLGRLALEALQLPLADRHPRTYLQLVHVCSPRLFSSPLVTD